MAMSDCPKCWDTPCSCGWEYRNMTEEARFKLAAVILGIPMKELHLLIGQDVPADHPLKDKRNQKWVMMK